MLVSLLLEQIKNEEFILFFYGFTLSLQDMKVVIVKYNAGNIFSVVHAFERVGVSPVLTDTAEEIMSADKVVFPGQGEASATMRYLKAHKLDEVIKGLRQPVLGICIGMQLMCRHSEEGNTDCLGIFEADVLKFRPQNHKDKVPQMGWNTVENVKSPLFKGFNKPEFTYFVHSYYVPRNPYTIAETTFCLPYSSALHKDNYYATQFHPEKSGKTGELILRNFLEL